MVVIGNVPCRLEYKFGHIGDFSDVDTIRIVCDAMVVGMETRMIEQHRDPLPAEAYVIAPSCLLDFIQQCEAYCPVFLVVDGGEIGAAIGSDDEQ